MKLKKKTDKIGKILDNPEEKIGELENIAIETKKKKRLKKSKDYQ